MSSLQEVSTPSSTVATYGPAARVLQPAETITNIDAMPCGAPVSQFGQHGVERGEHARISERPSVR